MNKILAFRVFLAAFMIAMVSSTPVNAWGDNNYAFRALLDLNTTTNTYNVSVLINVSHQTGMNNDFTDLKFMGNESWTIAHSVEEYVSGDYADVWLGFNQTTVLTNEEIYMYYGTSQADIDNITGKWMHGGDEFNRANADAVGNGWVENGLTGNINITDNKLWIEDNNAGAGAFVSHFDTGFDDPTRIEVGWDYNWAASDGAGITCTDGANLVWIVRFDTPGAAGYKYYDGAYKTVATYTDDQEYNWSLRNIDYTADTYDLYLNDTEVKSGAAFVGNFGCNNLSTPGSTAGQSLAQYDYIRLQKEVTFTSSFGAAEGLYYDSLTETNDVNVLELTTQDYDLDFANVSANVTNINANLTWNGTVYNATRTITGDDYNFNVEITMPELETGTETVGMYWSFELTSNIQNLTETLSNQTITINNVDINNCSAGGTEFVTFFVVDEADNTPIENGTAEVEMVGDYGNFSLVYDDVDHNFSICVVPAGGSVTYDIDVMSYGLTGYESRSYFLRDSVLTNATQNITLYLMEYASLTNVTFTVQDLNLNTLEGHILRIRKYDGNASYPVVAMCITNDDGECAEGVDIPNYYKFTVLDDSTVLTLVNPEMVELTGTTHTVTVDQGSFGDYWTLVDDVAYNCSTNTTSNVTLCEWVDGTGLFAEACLNVTRILWNTTTEISFTCSASASNSISYTYTDTSGLYNWEFYIRSTGVSNPLIIDTGIFSGTVSLDYPTWALLAAFLLVITMFMVGLVGGRITGGILMGGFGFAIAAMMGLIPLGIDMIIAVGAITIIFAYLVR